MKHMFYANGISAMMALLVLSVGVNVLQAHKIRSIAVSTTPSGTLIGRSVSAISGTALDGQPVAVPLPARLPTVVYYFSTSCGWCERNWENVETVAAAARGRYRMIAVTGEAGLQSYVDQRALSIEVIEQLDADVERRLNLTGTPRTVVIGADGIVTHEWAGAYTNRVARQVEDLFAVTLPGLKSAVPIAEAR